ncbi:hypothetical protein K456DRAFT_1732201 [Colletotrichum gloeosporioides 23]|nr:hypothetical protein K456DRAFT_1732201 [Colletotrichum gloeosporioides 23]
MRWGNTHITKEDFFPAFRKAFAQALTEKNIQRGLRGASLIPLSAKRSLPTTPPT